MDERHGFGALLRDHRAVAGLTQEELAEQAGLSARAITDLERGVRRFPYPDTIARLSDALRLSDSDRAELHAAGRRGAKGGPGERRSDHTGANLPTPLTSFIGREREVAKVRRLIETARLTNIVGLGGVGKTRLALQVATEILDAFADGVFFVDLAPIRDPALVLTSIAQMLGVREMVGQSLLQALQAALSRKALLLVLDNFEHVLGAGPEVAALLRACPLLRVLITSRSVLHISGEHEIHVPPLQLPKERAVEVAESVDQSEAGRMFVERARAVRPDFQLTNDNAAAVAEICRHLDGLPLALELAAARVRLLPPQALLTRLERRLPMLIGGGFDLPTRQQTLRSTLAWSYDLLSPDEQTLFRRVAVFTGGFTVDSAVSVCDLDGILHGRTLELIDGLLANSLLQTVGTDTEPRFTMLETVREYAREELAASGEETDMLRVHAAHYSTLVRQAMQQYHASDVPVSWTDRLQLEHDNLRAALNWSLEVQDTRTALDVGAELWGFWFNRGFYAEGRNWLARILALPGASEPSLQRGRILIGAATLADQESDFVASPALYAEGLAVARAVNDRVSMMRVFSNLAVVAELRGDFAAARTLINEGLELALAEGDRERQARLLCHSGLAAYAEGDFHTARSMAETSLAIAEELGSALGGFQSRAAHQAVPLRVLGRVAYALGDHAQAEALFERSLLHWRSDSNQSGFARTLADLGSVATARGEYDRAHALLVEAMQVLQKVGDVISVVRCLEYFGELAAQRGSAERALLLAGAAAQMRDVLCTPIWTVEHDLLKPALESARVALGVRAAAIWSRGRAMPLDQAVELAAAGEEASNVSARGALVRSLSGNLTRRPDS